MKVSRETRIGIFIASVLLSGFLVLNYLRGEDFFGRQTELTSHYSNIEGLVVSNPVYIKGFKAGTVSDVKYNPATGVFDVKCTVQKDFRIPKDTRMTIYSVDLMGGKGIRLDLGESPEYVKGKGELEPSYAPDMVSSLTNQIGPLIAKVSSAIDSLSAASASLDRIMDAVDERQVRSAVEHLNSALANADKVSGVLADRSCDIDSVIVSFRELSERLVSISAKADSAMDGIGNAAEGLGKVDVEALTSALQKLVDNLNSSEGSVGKLINDDEVYDSVEALIKDINRLVNKIEENPKKYIRIKVF